MTALDSEKLDGCEGRVRPNINGEKEMGWTYKYFRIVFIKKNMSKTCFHF